MDDFSLKMRCEFPLPLKGKDRYLQFNHISGGHAIMQPLFFRVDGDEQKTQSEKERCEEFADDFAPERP
jgi:hypothetical protein